MNIMMSPVERQQKCSSTHLTLADQWAQQTAGRPRVRGPGGGPTADSAGRVGRAYGLWVKIIVPCSNMRGCQEPIPDLRCWSFGGGRAGGPSMNTHT